MVDASKLLVTIIGSHVARSPHPIDWHLAYQGYASQPLLEARLHEASKLFRHVRAFANQKLIGECVRGSKPRVSAMSAWAQNLLTRLLHRNHKSTGLRTCTQSASSTSTAVQSRNHTRRPPNSWEGLARAGKDLEARCADMEDWWRSAESD